jgi:hypothetical protein
MFFAAPQEICRSKRTLVNAFGTCTSPFFGKAQK